jgi:hypothetical protein
VFRRPQALLSLTIALTLALMTVSSRALAQPGPVQQLAPLDNEPGIVEQRSVTWPLTVDMHALVGFEPHFRGDLLNPVAFGTGVEVLHRARIGGFVALLASEGAPIITPTVNGVQQPSFADRISIPFGFAARPLMLLGVDRDSWTGRLLAGVDLQLGLTIEHLRTSDDSVTTAGLHAAIAVEVPIWGGPKQGGVALRLAARFIVTPSASLDCSPPAPCSVFEPIGSTQLFAGLSYFP